MKSLLVRIGIFGVAAVLLAGLMTHRYQTLHIRVKAKLFFDRTSILFGSLPSATFKDHLSSVNLMPEFEQKFPALPSYVMVDPYKRESDEQRLLELRFGRVKHNAPIDLPSYSDADKPVYFFWINGPSQQTALLESTQETNDAILTYHFRSVPFDPSNGLKSEGYLFADSQGVRFGRID